jgi:hypothetical protein
MQVSPNTIGNDGEMATAGNDGSAARSAAAGAYAPQ